MHHFTVGQRRGLRIAAGEPLYVIATEPATQRVIVGRERRSAARSRLARQRRELDLDRRRSPQPVRAEVKIRNKHAAAPATLYPTADPARVEVHFDEPQRAVTPGQGAVFYSGDLVLGGGWIE